MNVYFRQRWVRRRVDAQDSPRHPFAPSSRRPSTHARRTRLEYGKTALQQQTAATPTRLQPSPVESRKVIAPFEPRPTPSMMYRNWDAWLRAQDGIDTLLELSLPMPSPGIGEKAQTTLENAFFPSSNLRTRQPAAQRMITLEEMSYLAGVPAVSRVERYAAIVRFKEAALGYTYRHSKLLTDDDIQTLAISSPNQRALVGSALMMPRGALSAEAWQDYHVERFLDQADNPVRNAQETFIKNTVNVWLAQHRFSPLRQEMRGADVALLKHPAFAQRVRHVFQRNLRGTIPSDASAKRPWVLGEIHSAILSLGLHSTATERLDLATERLGIARISGHLPNMTDIWLALPHGDHTAKAYDLACETALGHLPGEDQAFAALRKRLIQHDMLGDPVEHMIHISQNTTSVSVLAATNDVMHAAFIHNHGPITWSAKESEVLESPRHWRLGTDLQSARARLEAMIHSGATELNVGFGSMMLRANLRSAHSTLF